MQNNSLISSWFVRLFETGTYELVIDTKNRWVGYHILDSNTIEVWLDDCRELLQIPEFLPKDNNIYITATTQAKDQIFVYHIPYSKTWIKKNKPKIILSNEI